MKRVKDWNNILKRSGWKHDIYYNSDNRCAIPLKRRHFDENDLQYIQKEIKKNMNR